MYPNPDPYTKWYCTGYIWGMRFLKLFGHKEAVLTHVTWMSPEVQRLRDKKKLSEWKGEGLA